jgi:hypothetical protein
LHNADFGAGVAFLPHFARRFLSRIMKWYELRSAACIDAIVALQKNGVTGESAAADSAMHKTSPHIADKRGRIRFASARLRAR